MKGSTRYKRKWSFLVPQSYFDSGSNVICQFYLALDSLVCKTLALIFGFILTLIIIISGVLHSTLISILDWYIISIAKAYSSRYFVWNIVLAYYGITYSTLSLSMSSSHFSWG